MCQVVVMGPCTFLVTAAVTGGKHVSVFSKASEVWQSKGIKGFYPGGTAIAFRQGTCVLLLFLWVDDVLCPCAAYL